MSLIKLLIIWAAYVVSAFIIAWCLGEEDLWGGIDPAFHTALFALMIYLTY